MRIDIIAATVETTHGVTGPQTGFLLPNVMFAFNLEREHL
jgi:hypothetical protein